MPCVRGYVFMYIPLQIWIIWLIFTKLFMNVLPFDKTQQP